MATLKITSQEMLSTLQKRFLEHMHRHTDLDWQKIHHKLEGNPKKLAVLQKMEETGGEPDVVDFDEKSGEYIFFDCAAESPKDRRSLAYDYEGQTSRKEHQPKNNVIDVAKSMKINLLTEQDYHALQKVVIVDQKTSSWLETPENIRALGGAIFGDYRYATVFIYHNGAQSYYAARGFRGKVKLSEF